LGVGPTFIQSALLAKHDGHMDHYVQSKQRAIKAARTIERFLDRVMDEEVRTELSEKLAELDQLISTL